MLRRTVNKISHWGEEFSPDEIYIIENTGEYF